MKLVFRIKDNTKYTIPFEHTNELVLRIFRTAVIFYHFDFYNHQDELRYKYFCYNYKINSRLKNPNFINFMSIPKEMAERYRKRYKRENA